MKKLDNLGVKYTYINNASTHLSISNNRAVITNEINAYSNVDKVVISTYLQKKQSNGTWSTIKHWRDTKYSNMYTTQHIYYVTSGNYRVKTYFYAYDGSSYESTTLTFYKNN